MRKPSDIQTYGTEVEFQCRYSFLGKEKLAGNGGFPTQFA